VTRVARWTRFNANGECPDVAWRATLEKIKSVPGGEPIPGTTVELDDSLIDEQGFVRAEHERAQRTRTP
jgi:hypothetical protein